MRSMQSYNVLFLSILVSFQASSFLLHRCAADPTDGFSYVQLTDQNMALQKPYDKPLQERYSFSGGVRTFWVYNDDKPFKPDSTTRPRTEVRIQGHDYSSGIWQFEGYVYVPRGTSGVTIMQILGGADGATSLQLRIYDGDLKYYNSNVVETNVYDRWFRVNVIHNVNQGHITIFINGAQKLRVNDKGPSVLYFKFGVYGAPSGSSHYMESRWRDVKLFRM